MMHQRTHVWSAWPNLQSSVFHETVRLLQAVRPINHRHHWLSLMFPDPSQANWCHHSFHGGTVLFYHWKLIKIVQRKRCPHTIQTICNVGKLMHRQHYHTIQRHLGNRFISSTILTLKKQWPRPFQHFTIPKGMQSSPGPLCASSRWAGQQVEED